MEMYSRCVRAVLGSHHHVLGVDWVPAVKEERVFTNGYARPGFRQKMGGQGAN